MGDALEKILECPICLDQIENPKMLPCQHSFCMTKCLENLLELKRKRKQVTCPMCRKKFPVPVCGFPNNYVLQNLLEKQKEISNRNPDAAPLGTKTTITPTVTKSSSSKIIALAFVQREP